MDLAESDPVELMVSLRGAPPRVVSFGEASGLRSQIVTSSLMWTTNCYHINVVRGEFIINGGRIIRIPDIQGASSRQVLIVRRHRQELSVSGEGGDSSTSYLLGVEGYLNGEKVEVMLHISPDGREWFWRNRR